MVATIIAGFPGVGKSWATRQNQDRCRVIDSDSTKFSKMSDGETPNRDWPQNYIQHIKAESENADIIFVSTHQETRNILHANGISFKLVYPEASLKAEYLARYRARQSPASFQQLIEKNWDAFISQCQAETNCEHIQLKTGQYMKDVLSSDPRLAGLFAQQTPATQAPIWGAAGASAGPVRDMQTTMASLMQQMGGRAENVAYPNATDMQTMLALLRAKLPEREAVQRERDLRQAMQVQYGDGALAPKTRAPWQVLETMLHRLSKMDDFEFRREGLSLETLIRRAANQDFYASLLQEIGELRAELPKLAALTTNNLAILGPDADWQSRGMAGVSEAETRNTLKEREELLVQCFGEG